MLVVYHFKSIDLFFLCSVYIAEENGKHSCIQKYATESSTFSRRLKF